MTITITFTSLFLSFILPEFLLPFHHFSMDPQIVSKHKHSQSPRDNDNDNDTAQEISEGVIFAVGNKIILFSNSSVSLSAQDFSPSDVEEEEENNEETTSSRGAIDDDLESETASFASDSPSSKASTSDSDSLTHNNNSKPNPNVQWRGFLKKLKKGPTMHLHTFHPNMFHPNIPSIRKLTKKKTRKLTHSMPELPPHIDAELYCFEASWINFSLSDLQTATDNFSRDNLIGEGGYSEVYKGHLEDGQLIAVKRLIRGTPEEMTSDFLSELGILVHVNHPNISHVIGYGVEGGMHLVLPLSPHGSLASLLKGEKNKLEWRIRYNIALGTASGLSYLHEGCQRRIIHRDIKSANILLTDGFDPRISDFGMAKWLPDQWTHLTVSQFEGTFGYLPPEIFIDGVVDEKTDVYAYGVLLLEIITGRPALDESQQSLVMWAKPLLSTNNIEGLVDPQLGRAYDMEQLTHMVSVASLCIHHSSSERPKMSKVFRMLRGEENIPDGRKKFQKRPAFKKMDSMDLDDNDNLDAAAFLEDRSPQNQIALKL